MNSFWESFNFVVWRNCEIWGNLYFYEFHILEKNGKKLTFSPKIPMKMITKPKFFYTTLWQILFPFLWYHSHEQRRFHSNTIVKLLNISWKWRPFWKNGRHIFCAAYCKSCPPRSCSEWSPKHVDTQQPFTASHVRLTKKCGVGSLGIVSIIRRPFHDLEVIITAWFHFEYPQTQEMKACIEWYFNAVSRYVQLVVPLVAGQVQWQIRGDRIWSTHPPPPPPPEYDGLRFP